MPGIQLQQLMAPVAGSAGKALSRNPNYNLTPAAVEGFAQHAQNLQNDEQKYQAAVDLARVDLQDKEKVSDSEFKQAIDTYYDKFNPEKTAREMRGENAWTDFVGGTRDVINGFNNAIGGGIDFLGDAIIGGGLDLMGAKNAANDFRNMVTGEDLSIIPDILTDVALTATGVGIPAVIMKNAMQLSPEMAQGISGKDAVTLEKLSPEQQAANLALGFGGTALSAIPGIGKAKNIAKATSKGTATKHLDDAAEKLASFDDVFKNGNAFTKTGKPKKAAREKAMDSLLKDADEGIVELPETATRAGKKAEKELVNERVAKLVDDAGAAQTAFDEAESFLNKSRLGRVMDVVGKDTVGFGKGFATLPNALAEARQSAKGAKSARSAAREANKSVKPGEMTPEESFTQVLQKRADELGVSKEDLAKEYGVKLDKNGVATDLPVSERGANRAGRKAERELKNNPDAKVDKQSLEKAFNDARQKRLNQNKLRLSGFKGFSPLSSVRHYSDAALDNILRNANAGAPDLIDDSMFKSILRDAQAQQMTGIKGAGARAASKAAPVGGRVVNTGAGLASGFAGVPLAEMAQNGGGYSDAINRMAERIESGEVSPAAIIPMLLTGSKKISQRTNPGLRGMVGKSTIPHNALRSIASAERWGQYGGQNDTANKGFGAVLDDVMKKENENQEEE